MQKNTANLVIPLCGHC